MLLDQAEKESAAWCRLNTIQREQDLDPERSSADLREAQRTFESLAARDLFYCPACRKHFFATTEDLHAPDSEYTKCPTCSGICDVPFTR